MRGPDYDVEDELEDLKVAVELNDCNVSSSVFPKFCTKMGC